jgi:protein O-GlcNAc transferase
MRGAASPLAHVALAALLAAGCGAETAQTTRPTPAPQRASTGPARVVPQPSALVQQGEARLQQGDAAGARTLFERAILKQPGDSRAQLDLGIASELTGDLPAAEVAYRKALDIQPDMAEALNNLGVLLRDRAALDDAIALLRRATQHNPGSAAAHMNLALALEDHGDLALAEREYREALRIAPAALTQANLGLLLLRRGDESAARRELREALSRAQGDHTALLAIGNGLRRAGDPKGALQAMQAAISAQSAPTPAMLAELALAQRAAGERAEAVMTLERVLDSDPRYAMAHYILGSMLASDGARERARKHLQRYLELEPQGPQAAQARERLRMLRAKP